MEKVIDHQFQSQWDFGLYGHYKFWRYNRDKYVQWVKSKHTEPTLDVWDKYILRTMNKGHTVVYDSQALIWKRMLRSVNIVENSVPKILENHVTLLTPAVDQQLIKQADNLLLYKPLSAKYCDGIVEYLTQENLVTRSGYSPNLKNWLAPGAKIFFSIRQEFFAFNRFKETLLDFVKRESEVLAREHGIDLVLQAYNPNDYVNGQVKLIFQYQP